MVLLRKPQILVVDDDKDWRDRIYNYLAEAHDIDLAQDREKALKMLQSKSFDLVVMNVLLQGAIGKYWKVEWKDLLDAAASKKTTVIVITSMEKDAGKIEILKTALEYKEVKTVFFKTEISKREFLKKVQEVVSKNGGPKSDEPSNFSNSDSSNFHVFLAYNTTDKLHVEAIAHKLRQRGLNPWLDVEQIPPGRWFQDVIQHAIRKVKSAAIFIGTSGLGKWQVVELRTFISQCVAADIPVIPILLSGVGDLPKDLLFLKELRWVSFASGNDDPKALADLEWGITGRNPNRN